MTKAFSHERVKNTKHEWLTPPHVLKALGDFDLDPCAPVRELRPWSTANAHYDIRTNGLLKPWAGRVFCNPPYENAIAAKFLARMAEHGNGIVLIFARTETANWFDYIWPCADAILFLKGRITFHHVTGKAADNSGGAPSALIAYGQNNVVALRDSNLPGKIITLKNHEHHPA